MTIQISSPLALTPKMDTRQYFISTQFILLNKHTDKLLHSSSKADDGPEPIMLV